MSKILLENINLSSRITCIVICTLLITTSLVATLGASETNNGIESLSYTFTIPKPKLKTTTVENAEYTLIEIPNSIGLGNSHGAPMLPVQVVKLLLPPMKTVSEIEVSGTKVEINPEGSNLKEKPIFPYQEPIPTGDPPKKFKVDNTIYTTNALYPNNLNKDYHIGYSRGYTIFDITINPVQYNPIKGTLFYYPEITIDIELKDAEPNPFYRNNAEDKAWVEKLVFNSEMLDMYTSEIPTFGYDGGLCDPDDHYDYVIITTEDGGLDYWDTSYSIPYNWEHLMDKHYNNDGLNCTLVTEQQINDCNDYHNAQPVDDLQARIREFCKDAYQDWDTQYILIGGDGEWIPARQMKYQYESNVEADIYWSNLDNTFNDDEDNFWGEEGDDGFDLYAENFIGRLTCDTPKDVSNWMTKSFYYADSMYEGYLDNTAFYAGHMGWPCQGDDFIDYGAIKGTDNWLGPSPGEHGPYPDWLGFQFGFETWNENNPENQYDLSIKWTTEVANEGWQGSGMAVSEIRKAINENRVTLLIGIAHANPNWSLDVQSDIWESEYHNTQPFFIHDWGCHCGDFYPTDDGVLHSMLFHSDTELAFACVYHTSYGWGSRYDTNSSSALQMKLFWDYFFDLENNSDVLSNWQLGKAMAWSKDSMAPTIDWYYSGAPGSWRCTIQACQLFGDPAQKIKSPNPSEPPYKPGAPDGPDYGVPEEEYEFFANTTDPEGDQIYYMFDWGDGEYSDWIGPLNSGETESGFHTWIELGDYNVKVIAKDEWGSISSWSNVTVFPIVENAPPDIPIIMGPTSGKPGTSYTYTFTSIDPDEDQVSYYIDWDDGNITDWTGFQPSGEPYTESHTWTIKGTYTIRAKAKDVFDAESDWGELQVTMPRNKAITSSLLQRFFEQFPMLKSFISWILI